MGAEELQAMDAEARERLKNVAISEHPKTAAKACNQGTCWWPGCDKPARSVGLCQYHFAQHTNGTLLKTDKTAFPLEEVVELYKDVLSFADIVGVDTREAVMWLIAEGLNSYERRVK